MSGDGLGIYRGNVKRERAQDFEITLDAVSRRKSVVRVEFCIGYGRWNPCIRFIVYDRQSFTVYFLRSSRASDIHTEENPAALRIRFASTG